MRTDCTTHHIMKMFKEKPKKEKKTNLQQQEISIEKYVVSVRLPASLHMRLWIVQ